MEHSVASRFDMRSLDQRPLLPCELTVQPWPKGFAKACEELAVVPVQNQQGASRAPKWDPSAILRSLFTGHLESTGDLQPALIGLPEVYIVCFILVTQSEANNSIYIL